jgi:hypothetical protein
MVYFPDTGKPAAADTTTAAAVWIERIDSEYREMPGLRLTLAQAARLWGLQAPQCRALLGALVERGRLVETPDGLYCVVGDLRRARREMAGRPCAS